MKKTCFLSISCLSMEGVEFGCDSNPCLVFLVLLQLKERGQKQLRTSACNFRNTKDRKILQNCLFIKKIIQLKPFLFFLNNFSFIVFPPFLKCRGIFCSFSKVLLVKGIIMIIFSIGALVSQSFVIIHGTAQD